MQNESAVRHRYGRWQTMKSSFPFRKKSVKSAWPALVRAALSVAALVAALAAPLHAAELNLAAVASLQGKVKSLVPQVMPATVALISERTGSSGSGVIVSAEGLILTAAHVVQGAEVVQVVFPDGKQTTATVLGANYSRDSAMARIQDPGPWPHVELGQSKPLKAGDWVAALGHSAGFDAARTPPLRFGRVVSEGPGVFLTTDCTLIGGDSGGPLFDLEGRLVAIHSSIGESLANNNHTGIDGFREDWQRMLAGESWGRLSLNPFDNPESPALGILMDMGRNREGVVVSNVVPESPAAAAGVRVGDVIRALDGSRVRHGPELLQIVAKKQAGDKVRLDILRDGRETRIEVELARREDLYQR
jgi:serine protease Do